MTTGQRIQRARKRAGLSQKQLGEKLGLSASMIGQWENDLRKPKYGTLKKLANALDVWVYDLSSPEDTAERVKRLEEFYMPDELDYAALPPRDKSERPIEGNYQRIAAAFDKLNPNGQQEAVKRIEELTEIPRYCRQDAPQPAPAPREDTDTTPTTKGTEMPPESE